MVQLNAPLFEEASPEEMPNEGNALKPSDASPIKRGRPAKADGRDIEAAILEAASALFMKDGFAVSMEAITAAARVSKRTLYERYPSKLRLFEAVLLWLNKDLALPTGLFAGNERIEDVLVRLGLALLDLYSHPRVSAFQRLLLKEAEKFPEIDAANRQHFQATIVDPLHHYLEASGEVEKAALDLHVAAHVICSAITTELVRLFAEQKPIDRAAYERYLRQAVAVLLHGLRAR